MTESGSALKTPLRLLVLGHHASGRSSLLAALGGSEPADQPLPPMAGVAPFADLLGALGGPPAGLHVQGVLRGAGITRAWSAQAIDSALTDKRALVLAAATADVVIAVTDAGKPPDPRTLHLAQWALLCGQAQGVLVANQAAGTQLRQSDWQTLHRAGEALRLHSGQTLLCLPVVAQQGTGIVSGSPGVAGYSGAALADWLATLPPRSAALRAAAAQADSEHADLFEFTCLWMADEPLLPGRGYALTLGSARLRGTVTRLKYRIEAGRLERLAARELQRGQIGECTLELERAVAFAPFATSPALGSLLLAHPTSGKLLGLGVLQFALRRASNVHWQAITVDKQAHATLKGQRPCVVWMTGLSGAGKSAIANALQQQLHALGHHSYLLDGDNVRHGLNKDLGFTPGDRVENIRRVGEVARLMVDAGLIVITALISPFRDERRMARDLVAPGEFFEVFVDTPLALAEQRDPKGLYAKARRGELKNFTGIDSPYEVPEFAELRIDTSGCTPEQAAAQVLAMLEQAGMLRAPARAAPRQLRGT